MKRLCLTILFLLLMSSCIPAGTSTPTAIPKVEPTATNTPEPQPTPIATPKGAPTVTPTETVASATPTPTETPATSAEYQLTFEATWSSSTHPTDFPPNPHFSGLIGASHSLAARLWEEGGLASPGIKNMAETGGKSPLDGEIDALIGEGSACTKISGAGINPSPGMVTVVFTASQDCPVVSVVTMIAPSPDWFVGVSALSLFEDGGWVDQKAVELFPYDAGTDSGTSYTSPDLATENPEAIFRIETDPLVVDGDVPPLGTFTFTRLDG
jgi:hypothetical protein